MRVLSIGFQVWVLVFSVSCGSNGARHRLRYTQESECFSDTVQVMDLVEELHLSAGCYTTSDSLFHHKETQRIANAIGIDSMELSNILTDPWGAPYIVDVQRDDNGRVATTIMSEGPTSEKGDGYLIRHTADEEGPLSFVQDKKH